MKKRMVKVVALGLAASLMVSLGGCGKKQESADGPWEPDGQVSLIIGSSAGSSQDTAARLFAQCIEEQTGIRMNIVNNTSGGGTVANVEVMNAAPDGLTLGQFGSTIATDQYTVEGCSYSQDTYRIIGIHSEETAHLCINAKAEYAQMSAENFFEAVKERPGQLKLGISGSWNLYDTSRYLLEQHYGCTFQRVGIKGGTNCLLSLMAGDLDATLVFPVEAMPLVESGDVKVLAQFGEERNAFFPDVPTFKELGYDMSLTAAKVVVLPKDTPDNIYEGWSEIFKKVMEAPETEKKFTEAGLTFSPYYGQDAYEHINEYGTFIKDNFVETGVYDTPLG